MKKPKVILLGPQRPRPNVSQALARLEVSGPVALVTAGWQDTEAASAAELAAAIDHASVDLGLYARTERLIGADPVLAAAYRERQDRIKELHRTYRIRLRHAVAAVRELADLGVDPGLLQTQMRSAIAQIRSLDRHHVQHIAGIHQDFEQCLPPPTRDLLSTERAAVAKQVGDCAAILVAGGHVVVLLNRMRLFGMQELLATRPLIAWSAGAMAVSERVIVYHDHAPQGRRPPEVLDGGFGILTGVVPLPDAARRLDWSDRSRLGQLARRFAPAACVTLDPDSLIAFDEERLIAAEHATRLDAAGRARRIKS